MPRFPISSRPSPGNTLHPSALVQGSLKHLATPPLGLAILPLTHYPQAPPRQSRDFPSRQCSLLPISSPETLAALDSARLLLPGLLHLPPKTSLAAFSKPAPLPPRAFPRPVCFSPSHLHFSAQPGSPSGICSRAWPSMGPQSPLHPLTATLASCPCVWPELVQPLLHPLDQR